MVEPLVTLGERRNVGLGHPGSCRIVDRRVYWLNSASARMNLVPGITMTLSDIVEESFKAIEKP